MLKKLSLSICIMLALLLSPALIAAEKTIYALKTNQFYITDKKSQSFSKETLIKEKPKKQLQRISNIHIDQNLVAKLDSTWALKHKPVSKKKTAKITALNCNPNLQETFEDTYAIVCLNNNNELLTQEDKQNFDEFSQHAEIVKARIYSNKPEKTEDALEKLLLAEGVDELTTDYNKLVCTNCAPYVVLRSIPFK